MSRSSEEAGLPGRVVVVAGTGLVCACDPEPEPAIAHAARLRRMDRFGRYGFLAGALALEDAGFLLPERPDPRAGVVIGSSWGCRDSITSHDALVRARGELSPAVFAQTVHNSVNGELAIAFRLGGVSEAVVSGAAAGLEAVALAWRRVRDGAADLLVAGAAEGVCQEMAAAERQLGRPAPEESGAALVLRRRSETSGSDESAGAEVDGAIQLFEPDPARAGERLRAFARGLEVELVEGDRRASAGPVARLVRAVREGRSGVLAARDATGSLVAVRLRARELRAHELRARELRARELRAPSTAGSGTTGSGAAGSRPRGS